MKMLRVWRAPIRFFARLGTLKRFGVCHRYGVPPSGGPDRLKPERQTGGSCKGHRRPGLIGGFVLGATALLAVGLFVGCAKRANPMGATSIPGMTGGYAPGARPPSGIAPDSLAGPGEELWVITRSISH